jgi:hypothetical protein
MQQKSGESQNENVLSLKVPLWRPNFEANLVQFLEMQPPA